MASSLLRSFVRSRNINQRLFGLLLWQTRLRKEYRRLFVKSLSSDSSDCHVFSSGRMDLVISMGNSFPSTIRWVLTKGKTLTDVSIALRTVKSSDDDEWIVSRCSLFSWHLFSFLNQHCYDRSFEEHSVIHLLQLAFRQEQEEWDRTNALLRSTAIQCRWSP